MTPIEVGLAVRSLHEWGLPGDLAYVASAAGLYSFRELEELGRPFTDGFSPLELASGLECAAQVTGDEEIRLFAYAWVEDIRLRRVDDGDADYDETPPID
ncbi:hypothetical protein [Nonomuraea rhizosphaerae]|uniref:hypothetical protein n=1 Tax=Nonomuraea rhizosphaerae TaxID=2665663 RepID=UPI001C602174|nr:hypothetical protein [Nonomuraea rhizosphaerae]